MKKSISFILCILMLLNIMVSASAGGVATTASAGPALSLKVSSSTVNSGDTITVTVSLSDCPDVKSMGLSFVYDSADFELISGEWLVQGAALANVDVANNKAAAAFSQAKSCNGDILTFKLKVKENASFNGSISVTPIFKNGSTAIDCQAGNAKVSVAGSQPEQTGPRLVCTPSATTVAPGETVQVKVSLADCADVKSIGLSFTYDSTCFELISGEWLVQGTALANVDVANKKAAAAFAQAKNCNGDVLSITLKAKNVTSTSSIAVTPVIKNGSTAVECASGKVSIGIGSGSTNATAKIVGKSSVSSVEMEDTFDVTVSLSGCDVVKSMGLEFVYNSSDFELVSGEWLLTGTALANVDVANNKAAVAFASAKDCNGDVITLTFKAKNGTDGSKDIKFVPVIKNGSKVIECASYTYSINVQCPGLPEIERAEIGCVASSDSISVGDTVNVTVSLDCQNTLVKSMEFDLVYDSEVFELVSGEWLITGADSSDVNVANNKATATFAQATDCDGNVFTFTLKAVGTAVVFPSDVTVVPVIKNDTVEISCSDETVSINVNAKQETEKDTYLSFSLDIDEVALGNTFKVILHNDEKTINGLSFYLEFDPNFLECVSITGVDGDDYLGFYTTSNRWVDFFMKSSLEETNRDGRFSASVLSVSDFTIKESDFLVLEFKTLALGKTEIVFSENPEIINGGYVENLTTKEVNIIEKLVMGDIDFNDKINMDDVIMLLRYISKAATITDNRVYTVGDVEKNNALNMDDVIKLLRYVSKAITSLD